MLSKYYQAELAFLRDMGKAFAAANPATAGLLAERGGDPDVERLLEGFAFLAARVRERVEDGVPEIVHDLAELLLPHYLRPIPASSVLEFLPVPGALRARARVPAGTEVASVPVQGTPCRFRTSADVDLLPVTVQDVLVDQAIGANPVLRVQLQIAPQAVQALFQPQGLRLFVQAELPLATALLLALGRHLKGVQVRGLASGKSVDLGPGALALAGLDPSLPLLPWPELAPAGYRTLQELFTLPQKFLFFEVRGLDAAAFLAEERVELAFRLERPPELPGRLGKDSLRTNCVPVVNVFRAAADPVSFAEAGEEHLLRAAELPPGHVEVYGVESAVALAEGGGPRRPCPPFTAFQHEGGASYRLRRALSPVDRGLDTWISLVRPPDGGAGPGPETLSLELTCTNRSLPGELRVGDISQPTPASPTVARFRNVVAVTQPARPPLGGELHWRLLSHLACARTSLARPETMRALLSLYDFQSLADTQAGAANRLRVEGVRAVAASPARRIVGGAPVRGMRIALELDEPHFAGVGDAWLFAAVVNELLAAQVAVNSFCELAVKLVPSQREYAFAPRAGEKALL